MRWLHRFLCFLPACGALAAHADEGAEHGFNLDSSQARALVAGSRVRAIAQPRHDLLDR